MDAFQLLDGKAQQNAKKVRRIWRDFGKKKKKDVSLAGTVKVSGPAGIGQSLGHLLRVWGSLAEISGQTQLTTVDEKMHWVPLPACSFDV